MWAGSPGILAHDLDPFVHHVGFEGHDERDLVVACELDREPVRADPGPAIAVPTWSLETTSTRCLTVGLQTRSFQTVASQRAASSGA